MNARKFIAASSREALKLVRAELGEDAVILSNRKVADGVEIVAVDGAELAGLSETRSSGRVEAEQRSADLRREENKTSTAAPARTGKLSAQGASQAAALGAKVLEANAERASAPVTADATTEQQTLLSEIKSMRNMLREQIACMSWSDMQQRDPVRGGLLRDMINVGFSPVLSRQLLEKIPANGGIDWLRRTLGHNLRVAASRCRRWQGSFPAAGATAPG